MNPTALRRAFSLASLNRRTVFAVVLLAIAASYQLSLVEVLRATASAQLEAALRRGLGAGWPVSVFLTLWAPYALVVALFALYAARGPAREASKLRATPLRRAATALAPALASPFVVLTQDDPIRRAALYALTVGATVALSVALGTDDEEEENEAGEGEARAVAAALEAPVWRSPRAHLPALALLATHFVVFAYLTLVRDRALWSATVDLGLFKESLWNTLHGGGALYSSTIGYSFLGEHFSPVLFLLVPFYALWPTSGTLLVAQTLAITLGAWPLYRLALRLNLGRAAAAALAGSFLFAPAMQSAQLYDFHMDLLGVPALAWVLYAAHEKRWRLLAVAAALLCLVKEDAFVPLTGVALAMFASDPKRKAPPAVLFFGALLYCGLAIAVFIKRFGPPPGVPVYMGGDPNTYKFLRNFRHFARTAEMSFPFERPGYFLLWAFTGGRLSALLSYFAPVLCMPFLAGRRVFVLSPLAIQLLTDNPEIVDLAYHYPAMQHPAVYVAAAYGMSAFVEKLSATHPRSRRALRYALAAGVTGASVALVLTHPRSVFSGLSPHPIRHVTERVRRVDALYAQVPADAPVSCTSFGGPRLSNRREISLFPRGLDRARAVLVDLQRPAWPVTPDGRDAALVSLLRDPQWGVVDFADGAVLLLRGHPTTRNRDAARALFLHRAYEAEGTEQTELSALERSEPGASDGYARVLRPTDRRHGEYLLFGPYVRQPRGAWRVYFRVRAVPTVFGERIGSIDVFSRGRVYAARELTFEELTDGAWHEPSLEFHCDGTEPLEFRVHASHEATIAIDRVRLEPANPSDEPAMLNELLGSY